MKLKTLIATLMLTAPCFVDAAEFTLTDAGTNKDICQQICYQ